MNSLRVIDQKRVFFFAFFLLLGNHFRFCSISCSQIIEFDDPFNLPAGTRFDPGLWWYWGNYACQASPGPAEHNGQGMLIMRGHGAWGDPALSTQGGAFYPFASSGAVEYQIDFQVQAPDAQLHFL